MNLYLINCIAVPVYWFIINILKTRNRTNSFILVAYIHLLILHAIRDPFIYHDNPGYYSVFLEIADIPSITSFVVDPSLLFRFEPGFTLFNFLLSRISMNQNILFISSSFIIVSGYFYAIYRYSKAPLISVLILLLYPASFQMSFFVLRQHMACAIAMFALPYIEYRKFSHFIVFMLLATSFHYSAIILIPLYFLYNYNFAKLKSYYISLFIGGILFLQFLFHYVASTVERYEQYLKSTGNTLVFGFFLLVAVLYIMFIKKKTILFSQSKVRLIIVYSFYGLFVCASLLGVSMGRMTIYFSFFLCIIIAALYQYLPKGLGAIVSLIFLAFIFYFNYLQSESKDVFLYKIF